MAAPEGLGQKSQVESQKGKSRDLAGMRPAFQEDNLPGRTARKEEASVNFRAGKSLRRLLLKITGLKDTRLLGTKSEQVRSQDLLGAQEKGKVHLDSWAFT